MRKPKPTHVKILAGNPGKRPLPKDEPMPKLAIPPCPDHLTELAQEEWLRMASRLYDLGLLTEIDGDALAMYCDAWARWVTAKAKVLEDGAVISTSGGNTMQNPHAAVANKAYDQLYRMLAEFGMSPSSRTRVKASPKDVKSSDFAMVK